MHLLLITANFNRKVLKKKKNVQINIYAGKPAGKQTIATDVGSKILALECYTVNSRVNKVYWLIVDWFNETRTGTEENGNKT